MDYWKMYLEAYLEAIFQFWTALQAGATIFSIMAMIIGFLEFDVIGAGFY